jgi:hypothetical protein
MKDWEESEYGQLQGTIKLLLCRLKETTEHLSQDNR